jgi:PAS domain S-box-containing protein
MALSRDFFPGTTRMHEWMRAYDWEKSAFGPPDRWSKSLRTMVNLTLDSALPMCLLWGPDLRLIYNDAFLPVMGHQHPGCFGSPMREVCAPTWTAIEPIVRRAWSGQPSEYDNLQRKIVRNGRLCRSWFRFSYTPVQGDDGAVEGVICISTETTEQVLMERRQAFELLVSDQLRSLSDAGEITGLTCRLLGQHLEAARVVYVEVNLPGETASVRQDWTRGELPSLAGKTRAISDFGPRTMAHLQAARILKVSDFAQEEAGATCSCGCEKGRAMLAVPLFRKGVLAAVMRVEDTEARDWTEDETALVGDMAERTWTAVEAAEAEYRRRIMDRALHGSAARQAFQLELSDLLQPLEDPEAIIAAASAVLGRHLGVARVLYAEVENDEGTFSIRSDWTNQSVESVAGGISRLEDFGPEVIAALRSGQIVAVDDVNLDERTAPYAESYARVGVRSILALPLVTSGRLSIVLNLHQTQPYHWREVDLQRARDMAERTWAHVETARAQAALRKERDQSRYVFDTMNEGFAMLDPDCRVVQMNAEGLRIARLTAQEVIGRRVCDVWPQVEESDLGKLYRDVMQSQRAASVEYRRELPDHQVSWIEVRAFPALNGGIAIFYRDINKRKLAEEKLKQADRRKDEFVAMLAHELRNPLAPIAAAAEILSIPGLAPSDVKHTSEVISRQVNHMTGLVNDLLDISRVTSGLVSLNRTALDVNRIVPEAVEQVEPLIHGRGHQLAMHLASSPAMVSGDRKRLVQVLANLLNNAAKYTPPGGKIELRVEPGSEHVALKVRDNGIGMSPQLLASAFELFAQAERTPDRAEGGLGIGLALVKGIVELHGGTVSACSEGLGRGSEFEVLLPRADRRKAGPEISPASAQQRAGAQPLKVLIVDDNVDAARMLAMLLKVAGHLVFVENLSQNALQLAATLRPDVCLLDIALPDMDGNELARRLRAAPETSGAILVALTGYSQESHDPASVSAEFNHHMVKPIESGRLLALLRQVATR